jgi:hypothetical protein
VSDVFLVARWSVDDLMNQRQSWTKQLMAKLLLAPDRQRSALAEGSFPEPSADGSRLILGLLGNLHIAFPRWQRIGTEASGAIVVEREPLIKLATALQWCRASGSVIRAPGGSMGSAGQSRSPW